MKSRVSRRILCATVALLLAATGTVRSQDDSLALEQPTNASVDEASTQASSSDNQDASSQEMNEHADSIQDDSGPANSTTTTSSGVHIQVAGVSVEAGDVDCDDECDAESDEPTVEFGDWLGYNATRSDTTWLAGDEFGMFSLKSHPSLDMGGDSALVTGFGFHFLDGPKVTDMPPRLFDIHTAYHVRGKTSSNSFLDLRIGVGAFSDFEGSARKGIRFPGHAVYHLAHNPNLVSLLGVEVLDRDDISLLPVAGWICQPSEDVIWELVFPRPRLQMRVAPNKAMYVSGELGGGTWAIERIDRTNDNATYRDLRLVFGVMKFGETGNGVLEIGWAFDRELTYRSRVGDTQFEDALILRCRTHF